MNQPQRYLSIFLFVLSSIGCLGMSVILPTSLHAQQPIGGPYQPDSATVLLMHFDETLTNETDLTSDGQLVGDITYTRKSQTPLGHQVRFHNDSPQQQSYVWIPDTATLDLTGSWTIEMWVKPEIPIYQEDVFYSYAPLIKPDTIQADHDSKVVSNYSINILFGSDYHRSTYSGWHSVDSGQQWLSVASKREIISDTSWYHMAFVRDTLNNIAYQLIHRTSDGKLPGGSDSLRLIDYKATLFADTDSLKPATTDEPLMLGMQGMGMGWAYMGQIDEVRISNTVRSFKVPPIIKKVTKLDNQSAEDSYRVSATIQALTGNTIGEASLHYRVDGGMWNRLTLSKISNKKYAANIPSQSVGSIVDYYIRATTASGMQSVYPTRSRVDSPYYSFAVWEDSSRVLQLDFDGGQGIPIDKSQYNIDVDFHSDGSSPSYTQGDDRDGDRAMVFSAADSTWLELSSPFLRLGNATVYFKFKVQDDLPADDTRILAKGSPDELYLSNYQAGFNKNGVFQPAFYVPENTIEPCGKFTYSCLALDNSNEHPIEVGEWYHVYMSIRDKLGPDAINEHPGTIFVHMKHLATDSTVGYRLHRVNAEARGDTASLKIGGVGTEVNIPYFNGVIDDIKIYNYMTKRCVPDPCPLNTPQSEEIPNNVTLEKNYPNPFNPSTRIDYSLPQPAEVQLTVYDVLGRRVATLVNGKRQAGKHIAQFDAGNLSSGVYIYRLQADGVSKSRKMLLVK